MTVGTAAYIAPEQAKGEAVDGRADVHALGATFYELLTSALPFEGTSYLETMALRFSLDPRPPRTLVPDLPPAVERVCLTLMTRDPLRRPDANEAVGLLASLVPGAIRHTPSRGSSPTPRPRRTSSRSHGRPAIRPRAQVRPRAAGRRCDPPGPGRGASLGPTAPPRGALRPRVLLPRDGGDRRRPDRRAWPPPLRRPRPSSPRRGRRRPRSSGRRSEPPRVERAPRRRCAPRRAPLRGLREAHRRGPRRRFLVGLLEARGLDGATLPVDRLLDALPASAGDDVKARGDAPRGRRRAARAGRAPPPGRGAERSRQRLRPDARGAPARAARAALRARAIAGRGASRASAGGSGGGCRGGAPPGRCFRRSR